MKYLLSQLLAVVMLFVGCLSEEGAEQKWLEYVEAHRDCNDVDECVVVSPGCPLGCYAAVRSESEAEALEKAQSLIERYERAGRRCDYGCTEAPTLICDEGVCGFDGSSDPG